MDYELINKKLFSGRMSPSQKSGIDIKLLSFKNSNITDVRFMAYMLATSFHETARTMQPVEEYGKGKRRRYGRKVKYNGEPYIFPDVIYYGRGDVQLTWYDNYQLMGKLLMLPLLQKPELALRPNISAKIMIEGMTKGISNRGDFTGVSLENYFNANKSDPVNARKIINGLDQADKIAGYYDEFLNALNK